MRAASLAHRVGALFRASSTRPISCSAVGALAAHRGARMECWHKSAFSSWMDHGANGERDEALEQLLDVEMFPDVPPEQRAMLTMCVEKNDIEGIKMLAGTGLACAMGHLGKSYGLGIGVRQDLEEARMWFERGAAANDIESTYQTNLKHLRHMWRRWRYGNELLQTFEMALLQPSLANLRNGPM